MDNAQKGVLDTNIDSMKDMVLKKLIDEKNDLIKELETENSLLKRTIIQMDNRLKLMQNQIEIIQESEKRSLSKISRDSNENQNISSQSKFSSMTNQLSAEPKLSSKTKSNVEIGTDIRNDTYERIQSESRVMGEIQNIRKDFLEMMKIAANANNSPSPNIIYTGAYGHSYPHMMHQNPYPYGPQMHTQQLQMPMHSQQLQMPMGTPQYIYNSPNNVPFINNQTQAPQHWAGHSQTAPAHGGVGSFEQNTSLSMGNAESISNIDPNESMSVGDILKNSRSSGSSSSGIPPAPKMNIPKPPPMPPITGGSNANSSQSSGKGGMDMVISELKAVLNKKKARSEDILTQSNK